MWPRSRELLQLVISYLVVAISHNKSFAASGCIRPKVGTKAQPKIKEP